MRSSGRLRSDDQFLARGSACSGVAVNGIRSSGYRRYDLGLDSTCPYQVLHTDQDAVVIGRQMIQKVGAAVR